MKLSVPRFIGIIALFFIFTLVALPFFSATLAQEPPLFEISLTPQADYAVRGQPFTYTVTITNVSQTPLKDIVVKTSIPQGTTLIGTYFANPNWLIGRTQQSKAGEIIWLTQQSVIAGAVITFEFVVNVSPELAGQQLISDEYMVMSIDNNHLLAAGPPIKTQVLTLTPTPVPAPPVAGTFTPTRPASATQQPQASSESSPPAASFTVPPQAGPSIANAPVSAPAGLSQNTASNISSPTSIITIIGLSGLILSIVGLVWFRRRR